MKNELIELWFQYLNWKNEVIKQQVEGGAPQPNSYTASFYDFMTWLINYHEEGQK